jgi:hypothetical protein
MNTDTSYRTEQPIPASPTPFGQPQLELALAEGSGARLVGARRRRPSRASWWFQRMREVVEQACDWQPVLTPRPEQAWLPHTYRTPSLAPLANAEEQQICE